jgi:hypothetical protein
MLLGLRDADHFHFTPFHSSLDFRHDIIFFRHCLHLTYCQLTPFIAFRLSLRFAAAGLFHFRFR